jgi:hypothetical protein
MSDTPTRAEANALRALGDDVLVKVITTTNLRHRGEHLEAGTQAWARPSAALGMASDRRARVVWLSPNTPETRADPSYRPPGPVRPDLWLDAELED